MFRARIVACAALLWAQAGMAQAGPTPGERLTRLRAIADSLRQATRAAQSSNLAAARVAEHGDVMLVMPTEFSQEETEDIAERTSGQLVDLGFLAPAEVRAIVLIAAPLGHPREGMLHGRRTILFNYPYVADASERPDAIASNAAHNLVSALLDSVWAEYLDRALDFAWSTREYNVGVMRDLLASPRELARACTAGHRCDAYLGINDGGIRTWLTPAEIRERVALNRRNRQLQSMCGSIASDECYGYFVANREQPPAGSAARRSLIMFVRETLGRDVARAMLNDHQGSVHDRLVRATGLTPQALAASWRLWVLSTSQRHSVTAGWREAVATAAALALILAISTRSKRWLA